MINPSDHPPVSQQRAAARSEARVEPPPPGWNYAGFSRRALAFSIDQFLLGAIILLLMFPAAILLGLGQLAAWPFAGILFLPSAQFIGVPIAWAYFSLQEASKHRATFGKRMCGLVVTDLNGNRLSLQRATARFFGKFISCAIMLIGFFMAAFTDRHQALHDIIAETLVLRKARP